MQGDIVEGSYVNSRRKDKVSHKTMSKDPLNKTWANDKSKFGYKMLMKMGWSEGKGLGAEETGITENVEVKMNDEKLGKRLFLINI